MRLVFSFELFRTFYSSKDLSLKEADLHFHVISVKK